MKLLHLAWLGFGLLLIIAAFTQWTERNSSDDSGGPCAAVGFLGFIGLLFWTAIDGSIAKRKAKRRGFEVIQREDADKM